jgi:hypothetical protein
MRSFIENRGFVQNEFEEAHWDTSTGLAPDAIARGLKEIEAALKAIRAYGVRAERF